MYDSTDFVNASIHEVAVTLIEALVIVMLVIFAFLGSPRSVLDSGDRDSALPGRHARHHARARVLDQFAHAACALVLAIGLVVDDAIIVVENVNRHLEGGMAPLAAAIQAARELGTAILAMTVVLLAVYVPIGFQGGLTGALFTEFVFTLAGAVTVSAVIALTLSPMMCSKLLRPHRADETGWESRVVEFIDARFERCAAGTSAASSAVSTYTPVTAIFVVLVLVSIALLYRSAKSELAPQEDQGFMGAQPTSAPDATLQQKLLYAAEAYKIIKAEQGIKTSFRSAAPGQTIRRPGAGADLRSAHGATRGSQRLQQNLNSVGGQKIVVFQLPSLPGASGLPVQFVIKTTEPALRLNEVSRAFLEEANASGMFHVLRHGPASTTCRSR